MLGIKIGSAAELSVDPANSQLVLTFLPPAKKYNRNRKISIEELCADWTHEKVGKEWSGFDVGAEVIE